MRPRSWPGAAPDPGLLRGDSAAVAASGQGGAGTLAARLAAVEAGIRDDRHRQPANVVETIARLWSAGAGVAAIAGAAGVSLYIVKDRLRRAGVLGYRHRDQRRHVREVLEEQGARLIAAYEAGATIRTLAAGAGVCETTVGRFMAAHGVELRSRQQRVQDRLGRRRADLVAAYQQGWTIAVLAAEAGVSHRTLSAFLEAQGVRLRHDRGWYRRRRRAHR